MMTRRPGDYWWTSGPPQPLLTPRQQEILALVWLGLANKEIAARLGLGVPTVKNHLTIAYGRLGLARVTDPRAPAAIYLWRACARQVAREGRAA
jgi:DNA-binding NarL/FixJ family response regulator